MKKAFIVLMAIMILLSSSACDEKDVGKQNLENDNQISTQTPESTTDEKNEVGSESAAEPSNEPSLEPSSEPGSETDSNITAIGSIEELEGIVAKDVEDTIAALNTEWEQLKIEIDTYDKYLKSSDKVEAFYNKANKDAESLCIRMREYTLKYAELIMSSNQSNDDKYDDFGELYDCIYEDAGDELYDEIYDAILDDMYDTFYDGILDDAYDNAPYDEWSDARSDEYDWWSDTRSDVYDNWSDTRSDIYDFWSDIRGDLWDDDIEKAEKELKDFKDDVEKLKN